MAKAYPSFQNTTQDNLKHKDIPKPFKIVQILQASNDIRVCCPGDFDVPAQRVEWFKHRRIACLALVEYSCGQREILPVIVKNNTRFDVLHPEECELISIKL